MSNNPSEKVLINLRYRDEGADLYIDVTQDGVHMDVIGPFDDPDERDAVRIDFLRMIDKFGGKKASFQ